MRELTKQLNLNKLQIKCEEYFYQGYKLYFIHGWFCAYLSSLNDEEEDLLVPSYLILNEDAIKDEKLFLNFIDELVILYKSLSLNTYEQNKLIKPLISVENELNLDGWLNSKLTKVSNDQVYFNLLVWLYGYLSNVLSNDTKISAEIEAKYQELLTNRYYAKLYDLSCVFLLLDKYLELSGKYKNSLSQEFIDDYYELKADVIAWWEPDEEGGDIVKQIEKMSITTLISSIIPAINDIFYTIRVIDEALYT